MVPLDAGWQPGSSLRRSGIRALYEWPTILEAEQHRSTLRRFWRVIRSTSHISPAWGHCTIRRFHGPNLADTRPAAALHRSPHGSACPGSRKSGRQFADWSGCTSVAAITVRASCLRVARALRFRELFSGVQ
jgi:hypothetical protein